MSSPTLTETKNGSAPLGSEAQLKAVRNELRRLAGLYQTEELIEHGGSKIRLPDGMNEVEAIKFLKRLYDENQAEATWQRVYRYRPFDGVAAMSRVFKRTFGGVSLKGGMSFFGPTPPSMIDVEVGMGVFEQVPALGDGVCLPHLPEVTFRGYVENDPELGEVFAIYAEGKKACAGEVQGLFHLIEDELRENSIYRGKAIHDGFGFLDLSRVDPAKVVYSEKTQGELETNIFAQLRHGKVLQHLGQALKGAVLLEGTYGTGKTLAAYLTAQEAVANGWTFILVRPEHLAGLNGVEAFRRAMQTAELYGRAVVFVEDVDTLTHVDAEADRISVMLDVFDGARSKGREVIAVLTTNHAETIHKGMVRPGRIDAVIPVTKPDAQGIVRLCKVLVPETLLSEDITDEEWEIVAKAMDGFIPAAIAEACNRAVRYMIVRSGIDPDAEWDDVAEEIAALKVEALDLARSAESLHAQMDLLEKAKDVPERETLSMAFARMIDERIEARFEPIPNQGGGTPYAGLKQD